MGNGFAEATRISDGLLTGIERRLLVWIARRIPRSINSDHLTALALAGMALCAASSWIARGHPRALLFAVAGLAVNWLGDSLDGTLARVRQHQRPRYGFYVDHMLDALGASLMLGGLALSGYMSPLIAAGVLIAYLLLSIEIYLATYCLATFRMTFWKFGGTELRLVLAVGTLKAFLAPTVTILGASYRLFDIGGLVAILGLVVTLLVSFAQNGIALFRSEPLPQGRL